VDTENEQTGKEVGLFGSEEGVRSEEETRESVLWRDEEEHEEARMDSRTSFEYP